MDRLSNQFFANPRFALDKHDAPSLGHLSDFGKDRSKLTAFSDYLLKPLLHLEVFTKVDILVFKLLPEGFHFRQTPFKLVFKTFSAADIHGQTE